METFLFLAMGLVVGAVIGWLIANARKSASTPESQEQALLIQAAGLQAQIAGLEAQLGQAQNEKRERDERDREENKLLQALAPVKVHLEQMQGVVTRLEKERTEQFGSIQEQLKNAIDSDEALRKQTQQLSQALSSNSIRGVWGETQLRKLVELAGLIKHADFDEQASFSTDTGSGRADMVINLPGGKSLAIDSKVPFNSYQEASTISELASGEELARRKRLIDEHVKAVKKHIDDLATRGYWSGLAASPDFVIAFVPSESLLSAALDADPGLLEYAFKKNVALASPVSLFSVLKTINYIWRQNADETSVRTMIKLGKELYERVGKVAEHADKLGRSIMSTVKDYNQFVSSLESRVLVTARKLNDLDENALGTEEIAAPREIDAAPQALTASELTEKPE
ncbi:DNA recombination protein RmuC [Rhodoluna sp.]|uniref:DNA recombination protein RmuC n=1 Tax=Rhodoluna sp. TaxID=1969481 RepID=UPI0025E25D21|nr:DNA recombination protein RmuC [Rhodoluna sp.]